MKSIYFLSILAFMLFSFTRVNSQANYKVIKVNGTIFVQESNQALESGSIFGDNDQFKFETSTARAAVINPKKGRFILMPDNTNLAYAKANLTPAMSNISSRAGALINKIDLENHFKGNYVILDKVELKISPESFPMDDNHFFYIRYEYKGEKINKKLGFNADTLIIEKAELLTVDGKPIPNPEITNMEILYMEKGEQTKSTLVNTFQPVFLDENELKAEVEIILEGLEEKTKDEKIDEVFSYINEMYGKPSKENIVEWLEKNFTL